MNIYLSIYLHYLSHIVECGFFEIGNILFQFLSDLVLDF